MKREITDDDADLPLMKIVVVGIEIVTKVRVEWANRISYRDMHMINFISA